MSLKKLILFAGAFVFYFVFLAGWFHYFSFEQLFFKFFLGSLLALAILGFLFFVYLFFNNPQKEFHSKQNFPMLRRDFHKIISEEKFSNLQVTIEQFFDAMMVDHKINFRLFLIGNFSRAIGGIVGAMLGDICLRAGLTEAGQVEFFCKQNQQLLEHVIVSTFNKYEHQFNVFEDELVDKMDYFSTHRDEFEKKIQSFFEIADQFTHDALVLLINQVKT